MQIPANSDYSLSLLEQAAKFTERRQAVLTGNVANISTPNYKVRDLPVSDFQRAVTQAIQQQQAPHSLGHLSTSEPAIPERPFDAREVPSGHATFQDGGNRNLEREMTELTKNSLQHRMTVEMLASRLRLLEAVVNGRP